MAFEKNIQIIFLSLILMGCGGASNSVKDVEQHNQNEAEKLKLVEKDIAGYWFSNNQAVPHYEFFLSATEQPFNSDLKTGRIFENGFVSGFFYWNVQADGIIHLNMVGKQCMQRPLNLCPSIGSATIVAKGKSVSNSHWYINYYNPGQAVADKQINSSYIKKNIDISSFPQGEFFLTRNREFGVNLDRPIRLERNENNISIKIKYFENPIELFAKLDATKGLIEFNGDEESAVLKTQEFYVKDIGYRDFIVKEWYVNVTLSKSVSDEYVVHFEKHRRVLIEPDFNRGAIEIGDTEVVEEESLVFSGIVNNFISIPKIRPTDVFYAGMKADFDSEKVTGSFANTITFTSDTDGILSHTDVIRGIKSESRVFTWVQNDDGSIIFDFPTYGRVELRFIKAINGGYLGLWSNPNEYGDEYVISDFIRDEPPVLTADNIPGRYEFAPANPKPNGSFAYEVTFHQDKTVSGEVEGYWFEDFNGDIVSFDCVNLLGLRVHSYSECDNAFDNLFTMSFAHIRRIKFIHKNGNNYQSKYDAAFYGARFGYDEGKYQTVSFIFRWRRVGDEKFE